MAAQSLASVAYHVAKISEALLHALELEAANIGEKASEIGVVGQLVRVQKEKAARREIGKLTANRSTQRQNKITIVEPDEEGSTYGFYTLLTTLRQGCRAALRTDSDVGTSEKIDNRNFGAKNYRNLNIFFGS